MLNRLVNDARFRLVITTTGPVLVRSGHATVLGAKMAPVMTYRDGVPEVYLPGSSLKGVFRSHLEKIICSLEPKVVCDPFWERGATHKKVTNLSVRERDFLPSCSEKFTARKNALKQRQTAEPASSDREQNPVRAPEVYRESCPTCRLFGSTAFIGRIAISDAYLLDPSKVNIERRDGVGIDRVTGGAVSQAKFDSDVVSRDVEFITTIRIRNFEIWQLGMLFQVVADMQEELIRVGSGRSRGLGSVVAHIDKQERYGQSGGVIINTVGNREKAKELWGLGRWLAEKDDSSYGTWTNDMLTLSKPIEHQQEGIWASRTFSGDELDLLRTAAITDFLSRIQQWKQRPGFANVPAQESEMP